MEIDLAKVLAYSNGGMQSRTQMRSIMMDMYPGKTRDINVLLSVYESGIPEKIKKDGKINESQYVAYIKKIADDYGLKEVYIVKALNAWIDVCIGPGIAENLYLYPHGDAEVYDGSYTLPIIHNPVVTNYEPVVGRATDYEMNDVGKSTIEISKYVGFDQANTIIPTEIDGKKVIGIGKDAFQHCLGIEHLIVPEGIEYIRDGAFNGCSNLTSVVLPTSLKQLGSVDDKRGIGINSPEGVFSRTSISEISLPNQIKRIPDKCFYDCINLYKVQFPDELESIGCWAFAGDEKITEISFPRTLQMIEAFAFHDCRMLSRVILNEGLKSIGGGTFENCTRLIEIIIPNTVDFFGPNIFRCGIGDNENLIVKCHLGSRAMEYARTNNFKISIAGV